MTTTPKYQAKRPDQHGHIAYDAEENETWSILYNRQRPLVQNYACPEYLQGLDLLTLSDKHIPQCNEVTDALLDYTGWGVEPVEALISFKEFYKLLARKRFPAASFIRTREDLDYLQEPDIFHEIFGHCPLLTDSAFANFSHAFGDLGLRAPKEHRARLQRLYWFTVEFGLINTPKGIRAYGGGILSSKGETIYSIDSPVPERRPFNALDILRTPYRYDIMQPIYYVIDSFDDFYKLLDIDVLELVYEAAELGDFAPAYPEIVTAATAEEDASRSC